LRRHKKHLKRKMQGRLMNIMFPRIPLWDPDRVLKRWMPFVRHLMSPIGAIIWLIVVAASVVLMVPRWPEFEASYMDALSIGANPEKAFYLWGMFWLLKFFHEMGHAFACRRFGGECHEMGIMFLVFIPTPYVDASSAWAFPSRWQRMFVGAGGMVVELFLAAIAAFIWLNTTPGVPVLGLPINELACDAIMIAGFTTVIFNANPLLRYDGYYMLSDWLEIPNLQQKSKEYLLGLIKRHVFRIKSQQPLPPVSQRLWLFFYGICSSIYRIFIGIAIILLVAWQVPILGVLMALGGLITWLVVPVVKTFKYLALEPELHRKRGRAVAFTLGVVGLVVVLLGMIKFNVYVDAQGIVEPVAREVVNARWDGFVKEIRVQDGQKVIKGDVLLVLSDPEIDTLIKRLEATLAAVKLKEQQSRSDPQGQAQHKIDLIDIQTYTEQLKETKAQQEALIVRAGIEGQVIAPELKFMPNKFMKRGDELLRIETNDKLIVRATVEQREIVLAARMRNDKGEIELKKKPEIRMAGDVQTTIDGGYVQLINAAQTQLPHPLVGQHGGGAIATDQRDPQGQRAETPQFEMKVDLPARDTDFVAGQRAWVRLTVGKKPLIWQGYVRFLQLIETKNRSSGWIQF
jgi:putative peptide zinc metalloprotease protein